MTELPSWNDTATLQSIVEFVETAARELPPEQRVAVFDNDGTLWSEKQYTDEARRFACVPRRARCL